MFNAVDCRYRREMVIGRPAAKPHLNDCHAQCLEVLQGQIVSFLRGQIREAQLEVAPHDRASGAARAVNDAADKLANPEGRAMWQPANHAQ
jgi:hypothetical protein